MGQVTFAITKYRGTEGYNLMQIVIKMHSLKIHVDIREDGGAPNIHWIRKTLGQVYAEHMSSTMY